MIYHKQSKTMIITPTRCGSTTLHNILSSEYGFVYVTTMEGDRATIHGTSRSIDYQHFEIDRHILLLRNPLNRLKSIFSHYKYENIESFLDSFDKYDNKFQPCHTYSDRIDKTLRIENVRSGFNELFEIDVEQFDIVYDNISNYDYIFDKHGLETLSTLAQTIYKKDLEIGGYRIE